MKRGTAVQLFGGGESCGDVDRRAVVRERGWRDEARAVCG
jgi:hypothetical protein